MSFREIEKIRYFHGILIPWIPVQLNMCGNLLSLYFGKKFVKPTYLQIELKKLLNK